MVNGQYAPDPSLVCAFKIEADGLLAHSVRVGVEVRFWRVVA